MSRTIIFPVGISVLRGLESHEVFLTSGYETAQLTANLVNQLGDAVDDLSSELAILKALKVSSEDEAVFLTTDTDDGERAAKVNAKIAEYRFSVTTHIQRIDSLLLDDVERFRKEGLPSLAQALEHYVEKATRQGREPLLSVSGGIKPVIPYVAIYGMFRRVSIAYIFERTSDLVTLPPLPIDFDWARLRAAEMALNEIDQNTMIEMHRLKNLLGGNFPRLEGLFEDVGDGQMTLSAFGLMLLGDLTHARNVEVMLSPSARAELENSAGIEKRQIELMLDRVRSPLWRAQKRHSFHGTDLDVYKTGNTSYRLAGWTEGEKVYVAEVYTIHKGYTRELPQRRRENYNSDTFTPYWPTAPDLLEGEKSGDEMIAIAIHDKEQAEQDKKRAEAERDEALKMAEQVEVALNKSHKEADELRRRVTKLETEKQEADELKKRVAELEMEQEKMDS